MNTKLQDAKEEELIAVTNENLFLFSFIFSLYYVI